MVYIESSDDGETWEEIELPLIDWFQGMTIQGKQLCMHWVASYINLLILVW